MLRQDAKLGDELIRLSNEYQAIRSKQDTNTHHQFLIEKIGMELWRFFIDGVRQGEGLQLLESYQKINIELQGAIPFSILKVPVKDFSAKLSDESYVAKLHFPDKIKKTLLWLGKDVSRKAAVLNEDPSSDMTLEQLLLRDTGWLPFEKTEKNYLQALLTTFLELCANRPELSADLVKDIHKKDTQGVENLRYQKQIKGSSVPGQFRQTASVGFKCDQTSASIEGIKEFLEKIEKSHSKFPQLQLKITLPTNLLDGTVIDQKYIREKKQNGSEDNTSLAREIYENYVKKGTIEISSHIVIDASSSSSVGDVIEALMADLIEEYKTAQIAAKTPLEKLRSIVTFIRDSEQLHPFLDANCRTFPMVTFPYLCMENGLPPPIQKDPNYFDCLSIDQLLELAIDGMQNTMKMARGEKELYGVRTELILSVLTNEEREYIETLAKKSGIKLPLMREPTSEASESKSVSFSSDSSASMLSPNTKSVFSFDFFQNKPSSEAKHFTDEEILDDLKNAFRRAAIQYYEYVHGNMPSLDDDENKANPYAALVEEISQCQTLKDTTKNLISIFDTSQKEERDPFSKYLLSEMKQNEKLLGYFGIAKESDLLLAYQSICDKCRILNASEKSQGLR
jgi:hypothetical protein